MQELNYENDLKIDSDSLDVEWLEQPTLMMKYVRHAAQMKKEVEESKEKLDIVRAGLDKSIRINPEKFSIIKLTESVISSTIITQKDYKEMNEEFLETKYEFDMAQGALRALESKKTALENLVKLHGQQYFAGPKVPRDLSKEYQKKYDQKKADEKVKIVRRSK